MPIDPVRVEAYSAGALFRALSSNECSEAEVGETDQAKYLRGYLDELGAKTIVVEGGYTDGDYLDDFASYYVRCFRPYERRCKRLHFFSSSLNDADVRRFVLNGRNADEREAIQQNYLGFIVARPLPAAFIGRTILKTYPSDHGRRHYTAIRSYQANLFGARLAIDSLAYQEQDTVLAACATVALWSAFQKTFEIFGTPAPRPAEITRIANGVGNSSRAFPSHGLNLLQMSHVVRSVGLEPEVIPAAPNIPVVSVAYAHLRAGLPVILVVEIESIGLHAITLVGYSLRTERVNQQEVVSGARCAPMVGLRIDEFYAHDDQIGPFARIRVKPAVAPYPVQFDGSWIDSATQRILSLYPKVLLVPVYNKVRVTFVDVQKWIERFWSTLSLLFTDTSKHEWDIHLTTTNDWKGRMVESLRGNPPWAELIFQQQPRFIWSATLGFDNVNLVELLADATDMERSLPFFEIVWYDASLETAVKGLLNAPSLDQALGRLLTRRFLEFLRGSEPLSSRDPIGRFDT